MNNKLLLLTTLTSLLAISLPAQSNLDTFSLTACTRMWSTGQPVNGVPIFFSPNFDFPLVQPYPQVTDNCSFTTVMVPEDISPVETFHLSALPWGSDFQNGISVIDLQCLSQHILGLEPLSDFARLAGDINQSGSVTTYDLLELKEWLMNAPDPAPLTCWRVLEPACANSMPSPFGPPCYSRPVGNLSGLVNDTIDFRAYHLGDIDGDAVPNGIYFGPATDDSVTLVVQDVLLQPGIETVVAFSLASTPLIVASLQMGFQTDPDLQVVNFNANNFSVFSATHQLKFVYAGNGSFALPTEEMLVTLSFISSEPHLLSDVLKVDSFSLAPLAGGNDCGLAYKLGLTFAPVLGQQEPHSNLSASPASPNPFSEKTSLHFTLNEAATVCLEVTDPAGRLSFRMEKDLIAGAHSLDIPASAVAPGGLAFYRLSAGNGYATGKILRQ